MVRWTKWSQLSPAGADGKGPPPMRGCNCEEPNYPRERDGQTGAIESQEGLHPYATRGGGATFERRVAAHYLGRLLVGCGAPRPGGPALRRRARQAHRRETHNSRGNGIKRGGGKCGSGGDRGNRTFYLVSFVQQDFRIALRLFPTFIPTQSVRRLHDKTEVDGSSPSRSTYMDKIKNLRVAVPFGTLMKVLNLPGATKA